MHTAANATPASAGPLPAPAPVPAPFGPRLALGLVGVLLATLTAGINDRIASVALADLRGAFGLGYDTGSWLTAAYVAAEVAAMFIAPWLAVTFSLRRFGVVMTLAFAVLGVLTPLAPDTDSLMVLRVLQGLAGGCLPPLLMTAALRFLPWHVKLYGLGAYALTATFGPNLALPLAALWTEGGGWHWLFWQVLPSCLAGAALMAYGLPQDPLRLERFKGADWLGALLGVSGVVMLVLALEQGERLDWLHSPLIRQLLLGAALLLPLFLLNEWYHPQPLIKLQLLGRRNFAYGVSTLVLMMGVVTAANLPLIYMGQVHGFRPVQTAPLALGHALSQLLLAPLVALAINRRSLDARWVALAGLVLLTLACVAGSSITSAWARENFYLIQALQALGQPMVVVPLLMISTGVVVPQEGPFASAMVNGFRGLATVVGVAAMDWLLNHRQQFHSHSLADRLGSQPALWDRLDTTDATALAALAGRVRDQAWVLAIADGYLAVIALLAVMILLLALLPTRAYPPQPPAAAGPR
ncbi:MFS transporter [Stutzerimonas azotifigens]|uniref:MFS transporter n=1 Tax=Stutzerimonas azotifigens TaxID=291995 RepID=UPI00041F0773|nr:MFS transporter [Stutzerimonas azotifigens]